MTGSSTQPFGFTGEPRDATGLTYLRTRYFDPDLGRFISRDTWPGVPAAPQTQDRYSYAANNPTTATDPAGRFIDTLADVGFIVVDVSSLIFGPEKDRGGNLIAFGADVVSAFLPFVTGGGLAARAGLEVVDHADDAIGPIRWLDDAAQAACSFAEDTIIATPAGPVLISSVEVSDIVLAWDEANGLVVERAVTAVLPHVDDEIALITIDGATVTTTPDHPFFTVERGWVEAGLLWPGAHVRTTTGSSVVDSITTEPYAGILWDLTVEGAHTFFVGGGEWLVHNCADDLGRAADDAASALNRGAINTLSDSGARSLVGDPHAFKSEYVGSAGSGFNIGVNKATGEIVLISHDGFTIVPTGVFKP